MNPDRINELQAEKERLRQMGGPEALAKLAKTGRLNARERIAKLFDTDTFVELGLHADHAGVAPDLQDRNLPADGVITGWGKIDGRICYAIIYDFSVLAGTMGRVGEAKCAHIRELALKHKKPVLWLIDSAGARVQELGGSYFAATGYLFREQVTLSGVVPQVSVIMGPGAAGTAYIPALSDCVIMVDGRGSLALGGPPLVEAVLGEKISEQELGGAPVHTTRSGVAHMSATSDDEALQMARRYLGYFPANAETKPPLSGPVRPGRSSDDILSLVPDDPATPFDMNTVLDSICDPDSTLAYMPDFGKSLICSFARVGGYPLGVVASQSLHLGGVLENDSSVKAARFISLCDAFGIPLLFLQDVPGFLVGSRVERNGIIRHGAKMLFAVSRATVPKITIVIRKAYGAGYFVMCGRGYEPDYIAAWPTAEIALMGAEGAVNIIYGRKLRELPEDQATEKRTRLEAAYRAEVTPEKAAAVYGVDDIIDPRDTSGIIYDVLEMAWEKEVLRPYRKHGIFPV